MNSFTRRSVLAGSAAVVGALGTRLLYSSETSRGSSWPRVDHQRAGSLHLNDASELNPTPIAKHIVLKQDPTAALVDQLRSELKEARQENRPVIASAARHSMGAQSLARDGFAATLDQDWLEPDSGARTYRVAAGARWRTVIDKLDAIGFSPAVMQSNNDFGVASTFCVNAHGWPVPFGPFGSTVRSLKLMLPNGELIECSRSANADIFALTMGGYGLTGIITELEVDMVPNARLEPTFATMPAAEFGERFVTALSANPAIQMAYGRMDITIEDFLSEALMVTYAPTADQSDLPAVKGSGFISHASREIFRGQLGSDRVKWARWKIEANIGPGLAGTATRNSLMNEPVITLEDRDPTRTDILHEYFVSPSRFGAFIKACQDVIPSSYQELLNITLRFVATDGESVLAYATEPRIAAVMLFSQEKSLRGEADMARMTEALIARVLEIGGTYYLPYRLHATQQQFAEGYPRLPEFVARKRLLDPELLFRNGLWDRYMASLGNLE